MTLRPALVLCVCLAGCGTDRVSPAARDAASTDDAGSLDAGPTATVDGGSAPGTAVDLTYRAHMGTLDRAWLGYHRTAGTIDGLYFEISRGADDACPSATSPVPSQIVTVDGFMGAAVATHTEADGVTASFFDFEGTFRSEIPPAMATAARVEVTSLDTVVGTVTATVSFTFGGDGTAAGPLSATHCDSLDTGS